MHCTALILPGVTTARGGVRVGRGRGKARVVRAAPIDFGAAEDFFESRLIPNTSISTPQQLRIMHLPTSALILRCCAEHFPTSVSPLLDCELRAPTAFYLSLPVPPLTSLNRLRSRSRSAQSSRSPLLNLEMAARNARYRYDISSKASIVFAMSPELDSSTCQTKEVSFGARSKASRQRSPFPAPRPRCRGRRSSGSARADESARP